MSAIYFDKNWDGSTYIPHLNATFQNHTDPSSWEDVAKIIREIDTMPHHPLFRNIRNKDSICVRKGIHPDSYGQMHLTVEVRGKISHISLMPKAKGYKPNGARIRTIWVAASYRPASIE